MHTHLSLHLKYMVGFFLGGGVCFCLFFEGVEYLLGPRKADICYGYKVPPGS